MNMNAAGQTCDREGRPFQIRSRSFQIVPDDLERAFLLFLICFGPSVPDVPDPRQAVPDPFQIAPGDLERSGLGVNGAPGLAE